MSVLGLLLQQPRLHILPKVFFIWEKHSRSAISIPYYGTSDTYSTILVLVHTPGEHQLSRSALSKRAWAIQEWISRRIVFFTTSGALWKCKFRELDSWNDRTNLGQYAGWSSLLNDYSQRQLTYKSDRLAALDGLANEMQKARQDRYHFGIWTGNLPEYLLWTRLELTAETEDIPELPLWIWASRGGQKTFWSTQSVVGSREINNKQIAIVENTMQIKGCLKSCIIAQNEIDLGDTRIPLAWNYSWQVSTSAHYILDGENTNEVVGIVSLDSKSCASVYCLFLMISPGENFSWREYKDPQNAPDDV